MRFKTAFLSIAFLIESLCFVRISSAQIISNFEETDALAVWRVSSQGYILTPVALKAQSIITWDWDSNYTRKKVIRKDSIAMASVRYWDIFPNARLFAGKMVLRGVEQNLSYSGSYVHDPAYYVDGRYSSTVEYWPSSASRCISYALFYAGTGAYQLDYDADVEFQW